ncbi:hypothetical protein BGY98DRAFT_1101916 [Russula aff. rugulosa BPL654]|nr:hypothetical protein BGY98DRAFT_1101916 [Russula aff. rugulosa BPL654]
MSYRGLVPDPSTNSSVQHNRSGSFTRSTFNTLILFFLTRPKPKPSPLILKHASSSSPQPLFFISSTARATIPHATSRHEVPPVHPADDAPYGRQLPS